MENILSVRDLNVVFGDRVVIRGLSFDVRRGDNLSIIGPNGAGKTVLLKALLAARGVSRVGGMRTALPIKHCIV
jgi:ABC-type multidrug transport system ATPase subunit